MHRLWLLLLLVGCASASVPEADVGSTTSSVATVAPATTTSSTEVVPFETEVKQAAIHLLAIRNDVFQHPDVSRVSEYIAPTCTCLDRERAIVASFVQGGLHWNAPAVVPRGMTVDDADPIGPALTIVAQQPQTEIAGPDGATAQTVPGDDAAAYRLVLLRDDAGAWRINLLEGIDLNPDVSAEVIEAGLS